MGHFSLELDFYGRPLHDLYRRSRPPPPPSPPRKIYVHPVYGKVVGQRYPFGVRYEKPKVLAVD